MHTRPIAVFAALVLLASCTGDSPTRTMPEAERPATLLAPDPIPPRVRPRGNTLSNRPDAELWRHVEAAGRIVVVGLKEPGTARGVWKGRVLLDATGWAEARRAVLARRGVELVSADSLLPVLIVRVADTGTLAALRRLGVVDYVEPVQVDAGPAGALASGSSSGCTLSAWSGSLQTITPGDFLPANYDNSRIPEAWQRGATGAGVKVGLTDTGIFSDQGQLTSTGYAGGWSSGRTIVKTATTDYQGSPSDDCGHGTRMAGVIAAPRDGINVVGVAWKAGLVSVKHSNGVVSVDVEDAVESIRYTIGEGARIVAMAWQSNNWLWYVSDEIERQYYSKDVLFIAAAGTFVGCVEPGNVIFPAEMDEVVAVTGLDEDGTLACGVNEGPEVDLAAVINQPATGRYTRDVVSLGGSSNATAVVSGIAAMVWSVYPHWNRDQVRDRMYASTNRSARSEEIGWGLVNAYEAVGGFLALRVSAPEWVKPGAQFTVTAIPTGEGPFAYRWSSGQTTSSITATAPAAEGTMTVSVTVTDTREGRARTATAYVLVQREPPPEEPICDPDDYILKQYC